MIEESGGIQWPFPEGGELKQKERRLFEDGCFYRQDGKACFIFEEERAIPEPVSDQYPFILLTGRGTSSQWHTQTRTGKSALLRKMSPEDVYVEMNPADACRLNIHSGEWIFVSTRRGQVKARIQIVSTVQPKEIFMPMHYEQTNQLTLAIFDPYSRQPSCKICAANVSKLSFS